ncbi:hypothetical protein [Roseicitreum antarcticum]|uniref:hypothetical protein n=1 Tax=Roseicitreum antarcticum TaxID=564137 RepID=UPI00159FFA2F|nr:hypothetical protein [Roseicitreum antarcticum]
MIRNFLGRVRNQPFIASAQRSKKDRLWNAFLAKHPDTTVKALVLLFLFSHCNGEGHTKTYAHRDADSHVPQRDTDSNANTYPDGEPAVVPALVSHTLSPGNFPRFLQGRQLNNYCH